jgi:ubiquinone/menaquinone biosynthesis C-methylase UbiE
MSPEQIQIQQPQREKPSTTPPRSPTAMKTIAPGDFTSLAEDYARNRPDYSASVLKALIDYTGAARPDFKIADVGAGTGIWTRMLAEAGLDVRAVEPCEAMRRQGEAHTAGTPVSWRAGSGEHTGLVTSSVHWVTMASSFHWVQQPDGLKEFKRILKPGGFLTVLWNPREIENNPLHEKIEALVNEMVPTLKRVSSGAAKNTKEWAQVLPSTGDFTDVIFFEARHQIAMSHQRYLGAWRSVNDIQAQAGPERFEALMKAIEEIIAPLPNIVVPYKTRAWTARRCD